MTAFEEYVELLEEVEQTIGRISRVTGTPLACEKGCARCCAPFTVLPIEAGRLLSAASWDEEEEPPAPDRCPLLTRERLCRRYEVRPLICRVRGLPVRFIDEKGRRPGETCALSPIPADLDEGDAMDLGLWNARLYRINHNFCEQLGIPSKRIPIRGLRKAVRSWFTLPEKLSSAYALSAPL
jgi:hypothetical protein